MKEMYLLRGLPGCGKSTLATTLISLSPLSQHAESDAYFVGEDGQYRFDPTQLKNAHNWCQEKVREHMRWDCPLIVVSNTFTQEWEMAPYYEMAKQQGYRVTSIIVENRHKGKNVHNVPQPALEKMKDRFEVKLI